MRHSPHRSSLRCPISRSRRVVTRSTACRCASGASPSSPSLGLVRQPDDDRLTGALAHVVRQFRPRGDTGRSRSTAEAERNTPAVGAGSRGSRLALAPVREPQLPALSPFRPRSALLAEQGYAILRRDGGSLYAALDYGHSGAGHGHPDRLNVVLVHGDDRWLDDVGTDLRRPIAALVPQHARANAPLVDGRSQERVHGALIAYDDRGDAGWVRAEADGVAPGVTFERTLVAMPDYVIDELSWRADRDVQVDLPFHADGELVGVGSWASANPNGGSGVEDGFRFLADTETATGSGDVRLRARLGAATADARFIVDAASAWWRATAFGPPGSGRRRFYFVRTTGAHGSVVAVWDVRGAVESIAGRKRGVTVYTAGR